MEIFNLSSIHLKNFLSHEDSFIEFPEKGMVLIEGFDEDTGKSNGAGKTTICEALFYCLYGNSLRSINLDSLVRYNAKECSVTVELNKLVVSRSRNAVKKKTNLVVSYNGKNIEGDLKNKRNALINILGLSFMSFKSIVYFGSDTLSFIDLIPSERLKILTDILELEIYDIARTKARNAVDELSSKINAINSKLEAIKEFIDNNSINELRKRYDEYEKNRKAEIEELKKKIEKLKLVNKPEAVEKADYSKVKEVLEKEKELSERIASLKTTLLDRKKFLNRISKLKDKCPVCMQKIDENFRNMLIKKTEDEIASIQNELDKLALLEKDVKSEKEKVYAEYKEKEEKYNEYVKLLSEYNNAQKLIKEYNSRISKLERAINPYLDSIIEATEYYEKYRNEADKLLSKIEELNKEKSLYSYWYQAFPRLKKYLTVEFLELLTEYTNMFLKTISPFKCKFSLIDDNIDYIVYYRSSEVNYASLSTGEKQLNRIAVFLGLRKLLEAMNNVRYNFILFDEPLSGLDSDGKSKVFELLTSFANNYLIVVISHSPEFKDRFDRVITVRKKGGISYV